jgi:hypothetical protein
MLSAHNGAKSAQQEATNALHALLPGGVGGIAAQGAWLSRASSARSTINCRRASASPAGSSGGTGNHPARCDQARTGRPPVVPIAGRPKPILQVGNPKAFRRKAASTVGVQLLDKHQPRVPRIAGFGCPQATRQGGGGEWPHVGPIQVRIADE